MPVITLCPNGARSGCPPSKNDHERAKRSDVNGWSASSIRNQANWFHSIYTPKLEGIGFAFTLTVKNCPSSSDDFHKLRIAYLKRLYRMGSIRIHWLIEWQRRGVPHLHGIAYFKEIDLDDLVFTKKGGSFKGIIRPWLEVSKAYGSSENSQHCAPIHSSIGWLKYLAKHGSRGLSHYQRSSKNIPKGWEKTGRMWGYQGEWPDGRDIKFDIDSEAFWIFRRMAKNWRLANARKEGNRYRISSARRMLKCNERNLSSVRGWREWIPFDVSLAVMNSMKERGHKIDNV